jgi:hypothetical protein
MLIEPARPVSVTAFEKSNSGSPGSTAPAKTPSRKWLSVGPLWLPGITISGPLAASTSARISPIARRSSFVWG